MAENPRKVIDWHNYFLNLAYDVAKRSKDPSTQCGAIIVDEENRILSTGFNGGSSEIDDEMIDWSRPNKYDWVIHAEENALLMADRRNLKGCTLYTTGHPCRRCMLRISHRKCKNIIYGPLDICCVDEADQVIGDYIAELSRIKMTFIKR
jgi:dCMP deaminase